MAILQLGNMATAASGSAGGTVFSRNLGGAYVRARVVPVNRNTTKQTLVRANFAANSKLWSQTMTASQRLAWTLFAQANPVKNALGASIILTGLAMSNKLNQVLAQIGVAPILSPPSSMAVTPLAAVTGATAVVATPLFELNTVAQTVVAASMYYIFATAPQAPGKTPPQSAYRFITAKAAVGAALIVGFEPFYVAAFGVWPVGASIGVQVSTVNVSTGATTPPLKFNIIST